MAACVSGCAHGVPEAPPKLRRPPYPPLAAKANLGCRLAAVARVTEPLQVTRLLGSTLGHRPNVIHVRAQRHMPLDAEGINAQRITAEDRLPQATPGPPEATHGRVGPVPVILLMSRDSSVLFTVALTCDPRAARYGTRTRCAHWHCRSPSSHAVNSREPKTPWLLCADVSSPFPLSVFYLIYSTLLNSAILRLCKPNIPR